MKNLIYKSFKGTIEAGTNEAIVTLDLDQGIVLVASLFTSAVPSKDATIQIKNAGGSAIIEPSNYKDWEQRQGGDYLSSKKPMRFEGGQKVKVVATSIDNQDANWDFELLLIIQKPEKQ